MKTLAEIKAQYAEEAIGNMTTDEVYDYAKELESLVVQLEGKQNAKPVAYGIDAEEVRYILSGMLNIEEHYLSDELVQTAFDEIKRNFVMEEETEMFSNLLRGQLDLNNINNTYSGILSADGSVLHIYFHDEPGMDTPDESLSGDAVETFLEKVFGEDWDVIVDTSPFTFDRSKLAE